MSDHPGSMSFDPRVTSVTSTTSLLQRPKPTPVAMLRAGSSSSIDTETPYSAGAGSKLPLLQDQFSLSPDIKQWGFDLSPSLPEQDDYLHAPDAKMPRMSYASRVFLDRGFLNIGCLVILGVGLVTLFAGYPIIYYFTRTIQDNRGGFNLGGINGSGQIPSMGNWGLIDTDTPTWAYTRPAWTGGSEMELVFSDEFNKDGRTFYPGDDPYWEAVNLHYWATNNLEWYDPAAITTANGSLVITLEQKQTHNLNYQGGMIQSWNKFCFTGGYVEVSVSLPGVNNIVGLWPAVWTMGNLGRAGYGASLEGMWPYSYDACDVGTVANQSISGQPVAATINGDPHNGGVLSYATGQRLSRCTCKGGSHPGPMHSDGTYVGRAAPEIDVFEAQITGTPLTAQVSQSAQWAPFDSGYIWQNTSANEIIYNTEISVQNTYIGSVEQQATSVVTETDQNCYEGETGCFSVYGFEYVPGFQDAYITWISNNQSAWTLNAAGMGANSATQISARPVPQEPMYILMNLGMSTNFGKVDLEHLPFPVHMRVDYVRVYQPQGSKNIGCDPPGFPTVKYINQYLQAYTDPNLTTWRNDFHQPFPNNSLIDQC